MTEDTKTDQPLGLDSTAGLGQTDPERDIVDRLRSGVYGTNRIALCAEAADDIERLRADLAQALFEVGYQRGIAAQAEASADACGAKERENTKARLIAAWARGFSAGEVFGVASDRFDPNEHHEHERPEMPRNPYLA